MSELDGRKEVPRILIAEGPWSMKENLFGAGYDNVVHKCKWKDNWFLKTHNIPLHMMLGDDPFCMNCNVKVPNMFKTIWTLKNLDKIQDGAQYGNLQFPWDGSSFYLGIMNMRPGQVITYTPTPKSGNGWFYVPTLPRP